jgi:oxygen-independent coproporphyrinogen-3 oxidase
MNKLDIHHLLNKYNYAVPRYTSFPTAVQFEPHAPQSLFNACLSHIDPNKEVSLYVHIPFCHSLCHYCGCNTKIVHSYRPIEQYIQTLLAEIQLVGERIGQRLCVSRIHFGGGSPNYASIEDIERILERFSRFFDLSATQIDMECDPRLLDAKKIQNYARIGVSRLSLGIQDFNKNVQHAINRMQPFSLVEQQMAVMRNVGIESINFDLITGLPKQTLPTVEETLNHVVTLKPSRIAVFPYAHVPWMKKHQKLLEKFPMPDVRQRFEMNELVRRVLLANDYKAIGIDHFALTQDSLYIAQQSGTMQRNFQGYTDDPYVTLLGFGLSSISQFENAYIQNTTEGSEYKQAVQNREYPIKRSLMLSAEDQIRRTLIERLMCDFKISFSDYEGIAIPHYDLLELEKDGIVKISGDALKVTDQGQVFARIVASCFDPYFNKESGRHAKAI